MNMNREELYDLARRYLAASNAISDMEKGKDAIKEQMLEGLAELHSGAEDFPDLTVTVSASERQSIPLELARKLLPAETFEMVVQKKEVVQLNVRRKRNAV